MKSPYEFIRHELVDYYQRVGCEGFDLTNADIEAKNLFEKYMSKTKEQILSELEQLDIDYRKEWKEELERIRESRNEIRKKENINGNETIKTMIPEMIKTLSHKDLAKILTLVELEKDMNSKKTHEGFLKDDRFIKILSLNKFSALLFPNMGWKEYDYENRRNIFKTISNYANDKYEELSIMSYVFKSIVQTKTKIDSMIVHYHERKLNKLIIIECKTGNSPLTKNQKAFVDCIKQIKSDKVEYKVINVDYQAPEQLIVSEISD